MNKKKSHNELDTISKLLIVFALLLVIFSLFAPALFVSKSNWFDFNNTGPIGDTIGGLMNPFIAMAGVMITFLAFYIQYKANQLQREQFREELDSNKFENQFYEMIRLHKENVNEIAITITHERIGSNYEYQLPDTEIKGREVFKYYLKELKVIYTITKEIFKSDKVEASLSKAYDVFFNGLSGDHALDKHKLDTEAIGVIGRGLVYNEIFEGHSAFLGHYYRHLFQTVKFVVSQDEKRVDYSQKRNYLRILRAQLSDQEQEMLYYNWLSGYGAAWENGINQFFTDYRMIHNLKKNVLLYDFNAEDRFESSNILTDPNKKSDPLFEFQE